MPGSQLPGGDLDRLVHGGFKPVEQAGRRRLEREGMLGMMEACDGSTAQQRGRVRVPRVFPGRSCEDRTDKAPLGALAVAQFLGWGFL